MNIRYRVDLTDEERQMLQHLLSGGRMLARKIKRVQILLAADQGLSLEATVASIGAGRSTVFRVRRQFVESGLEAALEENPRPGAPRKLTGQEEALLIATACSEAPQGRCKWTIKLLGEALVEMFGQPVSRETLRRRLKENDLKPWQQKMWCVPKLDSEYVARMENVLDLYAQPPDAERPLICFDESPTQLIEETRTPTVASPGKLARYDHEYKRNGTANLFVAFDAHRGWRHVEVTDTRTKVDFAVQMRNLVDVHYPKAPTIRVVLDNLNIHQPSSLYEAFPPDEARRILRRLEFHYNPKHASWLNQVEIEIGVLRQQCLNRRIPSKAALAAEIAAWERKRNDDKGTIRWMFDVTKARTKMARVYPPPQLNVAEEAA